MYPREIWGPPVLKQQFVLRLRKEYASRLSHMAGITASCWQTSRKVVCTSLY
ncbi:hypothetical protein ACU8KH_04699 [Lachancea thermotolerans]